MINARYPLLRFVDSPDASAMTRLDFHDRNCWTNSEEWSITPGDFLGEPGGIGGDYGFTQISFTWYIKAESRTEALAQQSRLARELQRDETYLLFQLSDTDEPLWYKCHRSSVGAMSLRYVQPLANERDVWFLDVQLVADTHALGAQQSFDLTIGNDPATGGLSAVLPEIKGDAPTPLVFDIPGAYIQPLLTVAAFGGVTPTPVVWQAEDLATTLTPTFPAGASYSAGFAMQVPLTGSYQSVISDFLSPTFAGQYRLFARVIPDASLTGGDIVVKGGGAALVRAKETTITPTALGPRIVDLGIYAWPRGNMPKKGAQYTLGDDGVTVEARSTATPKGSLTIDYLYAVPVGLLETVSVNALQFDELNPTSHVGQTWVIDGEAEAVRRRLPDGEYPPVSTTAGVGSFPYAVPGATNVLYLFTRTRIFQDDISTSTTLTVSYHPRHTYLAGS